MLTATPVAVDIASEAFVRAGGKDWDFVEVMRTLAQVAATGRPFFLRRGTFSADEELAFDLYALKHKFLPFNKDKLAPLRHAVRFGASLHHQRKKQQQELQEDEPLIAPSYEKTIIM